MSSDGNTAIVGADFDEVGTNGHQGSATIFTRTGGLWTEQQQITASGGADLDLFGFSVALSSDGNTAIVGALLDDIGANENQGSATIFTRNGSVWTEQQQITASVGAAQDYFGSSVALSSDGNTAIVGAQFDDIGANGNQGSATIFTRTAGVWTEQQQITASGGAAGDFFGSAVALSSDGNTAIVGAHFDDIGANPNQGSATIFTRIEGVWSEQQQITAADGAAIDLFGFSVALNSDGNTALVGAEADTVGDNLSQGSATIFTRIGGVWSEQQQITASGGAAEDLFGVSVALSSDANTAIVGAFHDDIGANSDQGSSVIFTRTASGSGGSIVAGAGTVSITAADVDLQGTITSSTVSIITSQDARPIDLGMNTANTLGLTDAELDLITADTLLIGDSTSGDVTISTAIDRQAGTLFVTAGGNANISFGTAGSLNAQSGDVILMTNPNGTGGIVSGSVAVDVSGGRLLLFAGAGGIGTAGNSLVVSATGTLFADTLSMAADQFLETIGITSIQNLLSGTGTIHLTGGLFNLISSNSIHDNSTLSVETGATFDIRSFNETLARLIVNSGNVIGSTGVLTSIQDVDARHGFVNAILGGSAGLTKKSSGTLTLNAANTYSGATTINEGTLLVTGSTADGSVVAVSGGTLGGTGTVKGALAMTSAGGTVSPGTSAGRLTVDNTVTWHSSGSFLVELNGLISTTAITQYDQLQVTGANRVVALNNATLNLSVGFTPAEGNSFVLIDNVESTSQVTGMFRDATGRTLNEGDSATINGKRYVISYVDGTDQNDVVLTLRQATLSATLVGNDLVIDDVSASGKNNTLTVRRNGDDLVISDAAEPFRTTIAGATTSNADRTLTIPASAIAAGGKIIIKGQAGNDSLTVDLTNDLGFDVDFQGGSGTSDSLTLISTTSVTRVTHTLTNPTDGSVSVQINATDSQTISYTGLEPLTDSLIATDRVFMFNSAAETITLSDAAGAAMTIGSTLSRSLTFANPTGSLTINAGTGDDTVTVTSVDTAYGASLTINGDGGSDTVNLNNDVTFASGQSLDVNLSNDSTTGDVDQILVSSNANLIASGSGSIDLHASRSIKLAAGSSLVTQDGSLTLEANQQATATNGNFVGVELQTNALVDVTGTGTLTVNGRGGNEASGSQFGVRIDGGTIRGGASGAMTVIGMGGQSAGNKNAGIVMFQSAASITSHGANVMVAGNGGGTGTASAGDGIRMQPGGTISAGGTGSVSVTGIGANISGGFSFGVIVNNSTITSSGGSVTVNGTGGGSSNSSTGLGVYVLGGGLITSGNNGNVAVSGTGGHGSGGSNSGCLIENESRITAGGAGSVMVVGRGDTTGTGTSNPGVHVRGANAKITSNGGNVSVTGIGGGSGAGSLNYGVEASFGAEISAGGSGTVTVLGTGGATAGNDNYGVYVSGTGTRITSSGGNVSVTGNGGGKTLSTSGFGILVEQAGVISASGAGTVSITGNGTAASTGGANNYGVFTRDANSKITSSGGAISIVGSGGGGSNAIGLVMSSSSSIVSGSGPVTIAADKVFLDVSATPATINAGTATFKQKTNGVAINLGSPVNTTDNTLELSFAELARVTATTFNFGDLNSGIMNITALPTNFTNLGFASAGGSSVNVSITAPINGHLTFSGTTRLNGTTLTTSGTGAVNLNGDLLVAGSGSSTIVGGLNLGAATRTLLIANDLTLKGIVSGATDVGFTKTGAGTLSLTGANTYSGVTTVNAGTLAISHPEALGATTAGTILNEGNSVLELRKTTTTTGAQSFAAEPLTLRSSSAQSRATFRNAIGENIWTGPISIQGNGGVTEIEARPTLPPSPLPTSPVIVTSFTVSGNVTFDSSMTTHSLMWRGDGTGVFSGTQDSLNFDFTKNDGGTWTLSKAGNNWRKTSIANGRLSMGAVNALPANTVVLFGPSNVANATLDLGFFHQTVGGLEIANGTVTGLVNGVERVQEVTSATAATLTVNTSAHSEFKGKLTGKLDLVKAGTATLTLSGTNTYERGTTVKGGFIRIADDDDLGKAPVAKGINITLNGGGLQFGASFSMNSNRGISLGTSNGAIDVVDGVSATLGQVILGDGGLNKSGSGMLILTGTNSYSGGTAIGAGLIRIADDRDLGEIPTTLKPNVITLNGGTLQFGASFDLNSKRLIMLGSGNGTIDTQTFTTDIKPEVITDSKARLTGPGGLIKKGSGILTLSGANDYTGITMIDAGFVVISNAAALGSTAGGTIVNGLNGGNAVLALTGGKTFAAERLTLRSTSGSDPFRATLQNAAGSKNTWSGAITIEGTNGVTQIDVLAASTLTVAGDVTFDSSVNAHSLVWRGNGSGIFSGSQSSKNFDFLKTDSGTWTLSGTDNRWRTTSVQNGTLNMDRANTLPDNTTLSLGPSNNSDVVVNLGNFPQMVAGLAIADGTIIRRADGTVTRQEIKGNATLTVNTTTDSNYSGLLTGSLALEKRGSGKLTLSGANTYEGATTVSGGMLVAAANGVGSSTAGALGSVAGGTTVLAGATLGFQSSASMTYSALEQIRVNGTGVDGRGAIQNVSGTNAFSGKVVLGTDSAIAVDQGSLRLSGIIEGTGALTKSGAGSLTLSGANTYSGVTTISNGTLIAAGNGALGVGGIPASGTTVMAGATLGFEHPTSLSYSVQEQVTVDGAGILGRGAIQNVSGNNGFAGKIVLGTDSLMAVNQGSLSLSGIIEGTGGLAKVGTGALALSGANTYTGTTTIHAGTVAISNASALGSTAGRTILNGGNSVLELSGGIAFAEEPLTLRSTLAQSTAKLRNTSSPNTNTWRGAITIEGNNGVTEIEALKGPTPLPTPLPAIQPLLIVTGNVTFDPSVTTHDLLWRGEGFGEFQGNQLGNRFIKTDSGTWTLTKAGHDFSSLAIAAGTVKMGQANVLPSSSTVVMGSSEDLVGRLDLNGNRQIVAAIDVSNLSPKATNAASQIITSATAATLTVNGATDSSYEGQLTSSLALEKSGSGKLTLSGVNSYSGVTTISGGTLIAASNGALGAAGSTSGTTVSAGATVSLLTSTVLSVAEPLTVNGTGVNGLGAIQNLGGSNTLSSRITLGTDSVVAVPVGSLSLSGIIDGTGGLTKTGTETLTLSGSNVYGGLTTITGGRLSLTGTLGSTAAGTVIADGATLSVGGAINVAEPISLRGSGVGSLGALLGVNGAAISGPMALSGNATVGFANTTANSSFTVSGNIADGGSGFGMTFNPSAGQTVLLSGSNTYTGATAVVSGRLVVNGTHDGPISLASGAVLGGEGVIYGAVTANGTVSPGSSPGILHTGNLTLVGGSSIFAAEINGTIPGDASISHDQLDVRGIVSLGGAALSTSGSKLTSAQVTTLADAGKSIVLVSNDGVDPVVGRFAGLSEGAIVAVDNQKMVISYVGGTGNDVVLIPPSVNVAVAPQSVLENSGQSLVYTFTRNVVTTDPVTVTFTAGGTAKFSDDYTRPGFTTAGGTVTIPGGVASATVTISPKVDSNVESDESVELTIKNVSTVANGLPYFISSRKLARGLITNDDTSVSLSVSTSSINAISPTSVSEDGGNNLVYTFSRAGVTNSSLDVNFSLGGVAIAITDYSVTGASIIPAPSGTTGRVHFPPDVSTISVSVDPTLDNSFEPDETVIFTVTNGTGYTVAGRNSAKGTILNDDSSVTVSVSPAKVVEDGPTNGNLIYTFTRVGPVTSALPVTFGLGGTATRPGVIGADYSVPLGQANVNYVSGNTTGTVTIPVNAKSATVTVAPTGDPLAEEDESVVLSVANGTGYSIGSVGSATGTIENNDTTVTVAVAQSDVVIEGELIDRAPTTLQFVFTRIGPTTATLTAAFQVAGSAVFQGSGATVPNADYTQSGATFNVASSPTGSTGTGTVTFAAGASNATVTITPINDAIAEADKTVVLTLTAGSTAYSFPPNTPATGKILDDDTEVFAAVSSPSREDNDATTNLKFTFVRVGSLTAPLTVNFTLSGDAVFNSDYTLSGAESFNPSGTGVTGTIKFAVGASTAVLTIKPIADQSVEPDETVELALETGPYSVSEPSFLVGKILDSLMGELP